MTSETREKYAAHLRSIGKSDHPYCLEFPEAKEEVKEEVKTKKEKKK